MGFLGKAGRLVRHLFRIQTGIGEQYEPLPAGPDSVATILLPLMGLVVGAVCVLAAVIAQLLGFYELSTLGGIAVLAALGGARQANAVTGLRRGSGGINGGGVLFTALAAIFLVYGLNMLGNMRGAEMMRAALLYLPVAGALAMVSAASVMPEPEAPMPLSSAKGLHMVLAAALVLVIMLPRFAFSSLAYAAVAVLAGSLAALIGGRKEYRADLIYIAAAVAELAFLLLLLLSNKPIIYY